MWRNERSLPLSELARAMASNAQDDLTGEDAGAEREYGHGAHAEHRAIEQGEGRSPSDIRGRREPAPVAGRHIALRPLRTELKPPAPDRTTSVTRRKSPWLLAILVVRAAVVFRCLAGRL